jgi:hypothetical protein
MINFEPYRKSLAVESDPLMRWAIMDAFLLARFLDKVKNRFHKEKGIRKS